MMTFKTDQAFEEFINNLKNKLAKNALFAAIVFIAYSFIMFRKEGGVLDKTYILCEILFFAILAGIYLNQIISLRNTINNTAEEISFIDNEVMIKTYPFDFFFITNKKAQTLTANTHKIFVKKTPYPISQGFKESVLLFIVKDLSIFIIPDHLPPNFTGVFLEQKKASETLN